MRMILCFIFFVLLFMPAENLQAQSAELAIIEYTYFPQKDSDNSFRRFRTFFNFPIKVGEKDSYLLPGVGYENINFKFEEEIPFENKGDLERYQAFTLSLGYTFKLKNDWRFAASTGGILTSNLEEGKAINDDFLYTGSVFIIKDKTGEEEVVKPWRLVLGLYYSTTSGFPFPLPVINYYREMSPKWSFSAGVPKTNLNYSFNEKHSLQAFATLDGFFANIQENRRLSTTGRVAENISMTIVLGGIGYEYNFTKHLAYYIYAGHTLLNDIRFRDDDRDDVYIINDSNTFYGRSGVKFKI